MDDEMDLYLGRCLKNWSASQPAPQMDRETLLQNAASAARGAKIKNPRLRGLQDRLAARPAPYHPDLEWYSIPLAQSRLWFFHLITDTRTLAA
jgi:hypothetical protein